MPIISRRKLWWSQGYFSGAAAASLVYPGDVISGAIGHWGGESYNAAYATGSNPAFDVVDTATGLISTTINITSGGRADVAAINALGYGVSIAKAYDQSGSGNHVTQATLANMPTLVVSGLNALMTCASGQNLAIGNWNGGVDVAQPWTISTVFKDTGSNPAQGGSICVARSTGSGVAGIYSNDGSSNLIECYAGSSLSTAAANGAFHSVSAVGNGGSSDTNLNGTAHTGSAGTRILGKDALYLGQDNSGFDFFVGVIGRVTLYPAAFSSGNSIAMSANDHTFWGF